MAADSTQERHRPGVFKQPNKTHKTGRHKSKGQLQKETKGRVNKVSVKKLTKGSLTRNERRNQAQQVRKTKRDEAIAKKRGRGGSDSPPFIVAVVPLCEGLDREAAIEQMKICDEEATVITNDLGTCHISVPRLKQRFSVIQPEYGNMYALLDAAKVADAFVFLVSPEFGVDRYGEHCLSCVFAQGMPAAVFGIQGLQSVPIKKQGEAKKMVQKQLEKRFPDARFHGLDVSQDALLILRTVGTQKMNSVTYRDRRPHLLAEDLSYELTDEQAGLGVLQVSGFVRGTSLSVNNLIHISGWDTYQMVQIDAPNDPYPLIQKAQKKRKGEAGEAMEADVKVLEHVNPSNQISLQSEVVPDPMDAEQTWPTEEELEEAQEERKKKVVKRVPKGTSDYQAAWIIDEDEHEEDDDDDEDEDEDEFGEEKMSESDDEDEEEEEEEEEESKSRKVSFASTLETGADEYESMEMEAGDEDYDTTIDVHEEMAMFEKLKAARQDSMFPDEVDTPRDGNARDRFQRYRGLKSFRTTPWDPKEDLPLDYARIYQFENFRSTKKKVLAGSKDDSGALPGWFVTIHINNVPRELMENYKPGSPVVLFGLLKHEQKMSVVHFLLKRHPTSNLPIKSKERVIFHCGFRRFSACPVYSQHTNGNKHKFERYLQDVTVATVFAPIMFPPGPVIMFKDRGFGRQDIVATGNVLSVNPDRIIVKRLVLSGHPFKINKKSCVVRYLFFNREDIMWFKPVELHTKWGRRGHIKEPLGTHGHMKCIFDGQLKSQDTVLLNLYKRMYPKWTYEPHVLTPGVLTYAPSLQSLSTSASSKPKVQEPMESFFD